ncbi:MAG TPA: flagellar biosynthesis protein FlhF, partial [Janthinobacterium sp.]|nr:flagellar biosynthesis protein FlhF [Janthinobacterium sp.]
MNVKKFTAATSREALRKVREALGPDAVILSNRPLDGVVEILALA